MKKLTNKEIKDRCSYLELKKDPFIDLGNEIWITPKVLAILFDRHITWVYNLAKKNSLIRKRKSGKWVYKYQDFYDLMATKRSKKTKRKNNPSPNMEYFYCHSCGYENFNVYVNYSWTDASGDLFSCPQCGHDSSDFTRIDEEMHELNKL